MKIERIERKRRETEEKEREEGGRERPFETSERSITSPRSNIRRIDSEKNGKFLKISEWGGAEGAKD